MGATLASPPGRGPPCFRICGQIFHRSGSLHPSADRAPVFNQLYIIEANTAIKHRMSQSANNSCRNDVMRTIHNVMEVHSPYLLAYRHMAEVERIESAKSIAECQSITMQFRVGKDRRRYNTPHHDEVAVVFVGKDGAPPMERDIIVYPRDQPLQHISYM